MNQVIYDPYVLRFKAEREWPDHQPFMLDFLAKQKIDGLWVRIAKPGVGMTGLGTGIVAHGLDLIVIAIHCKSEMLITFLHEVAHWLNPSVYGRINPVRLDEDYVELLAREWYRSITGKPYKETHYYQPYLI